MCELPPILQRIAKDIQNEDDRDASFSAKMALVKEFFERPQELLLVLDSSAITEDVVRAIRAHLDIIIRKPLEATLLWIGRSLHKNKITSIVYERAWKALHTLCTTHSPEQIAHVLEHEYFPEEFTNAILYALPEAFSCAIQDTDLEE